MNEARLFRNNLEFLDRDADVPRLRSRTPFKATTLCCLQLPALSVRTRFDFQRPQGGSHVVAALHQGIDTAFVGRFRHGPRLNGCLG
jgi:hypothetical protein